MFINGYANLPTGRSSMKRKLLLVVVGISLVFEIIFAVAGLVTPVWTLGQFGLSATNETLFLAFVLSWIFIFISAVCALTLWQIKHNNPNGKILADLLGFWWISVGIAIFFKAGKIDNLFIDSLKGLLIVGLNRGLNRGLTRERK